jgi:hypothetical protein
MSDTHDLVLCTDIHESSILLQGAKNTDRSLAQWTRAVPYEGKGREFESLKTVQNTKNTMRRLV